MAKIDLYIDPYSRSLQRLIAHTVVCVTMQSGREVVRGACILHDPNSADDLAIRAPPSRVGFMSIGNADRRATRPWSL